MMNNIEYTIENIKDRIATTNDPIEKEMLYDLGYFKFGINLRLIKN